ncbi:MAG TPA: phage holin family protein [Steroidobacteraceae bacterium]
MDAPARPAPSTAPTEAPPATLSGLLGAGLDAMRTRLDLAAVELEIHLLALMQVLVCLIGALGCALLALAFGATTVIVALWDTHRTVGLLGGTALFVGLAVLFGALGVRTLRKQPRVLESTLQELRKDQHREGGGL